MGFDVGTWLLLKILLLKISFGALKRYWLLDGNCIEEGHPKII